MTLPRPLPLLALAASLLAGPALAQITLYERGNLQGRSFSTGETVHDLRNQGFDNRANSVRVTGGRWELCDRAGHAGNCITLRPGRYTALGSLGLERRISSVRDLSDDGDDRRARPQPVAGYERQRGERLFEAPVSSVRAVMGAATQRCWTEQVPAPRQRSDTNVPAAVAGALLGGILGHQIGGGTGRDIATVGGVVAGAAVGSRVGGSRGDDDRGTRTVQRCSSDTRGQQPAYWDVAYRFRGQDHRVQLARQPGASVTVNRDGEPRE